VLSIPFVVALLRQLGTDERRKAALADAELDEATADGASALWWENDPALRDRFSR
jgi:hypothetical protein